MGPAPPRIVTRRFRFLSPALWCGLALGWAPLAAQAPPPPAEPQAEVAAPAPRLVVDSNTIDLGQLVRGESAEARFALRNEGDAVLRVLRAKPG